MQTQLQQVPVQLAPTAVAANPQQQQLAAVGLLQQQQSLHPPAQPGPPQAASSQHLRLLQVLGWASLARGRGSLSGWRWAGSGRTARRRVQVSSAPLTNQLPHSSPIRRPQPRQQIANSTLSRVSSLSLCTTMQTLPRPHSQQTRCS
jgi:hypothetical protein